MDDVKMKSLIMDVNVLVYIHDVLLLKKKSNNFINSRTYEILHEKNRTTIMKYLKYSKNVFISFILNLIILKSIIEQIYDIRFLVFSIISIVFGILFVRCKDDIVSLRYQLKAKKAVQYAIKNYTYDEYVLFLDQYLSEESTKKYISKSSINKRKY